MNLIVPISYFSGTPKSEIWELNTETKQKNLVSTLPNSERDVTGKGITSITWLNHNKLVGCDFNRVFIFDPASKELVTVKTSDEYNDLHHISVNGDRVYLANTGRDCIDILDHGLRNISCIDFLSESEALARVDGNYDVTGEYFDIDLKGIEFHLRKVPDKWHINHTTRVINGFDSRVVATSFSKQCLIDAETMEPLCREFATQPHDGVVANGYIWVTTVSGQIYRSTLSFPLEFEVYFNLFQNAPFEGWCRGLLVTRDAIFVAITAIQKESTRTKWLSVPATETRTGIYRIDLCSISVDDFYDFSDANGSRIFSILEASKHAKTA